MCLGVTPVGYMQGKHELVFSSLHSVLQTMPILQRTAGISSKFQGFSSPSFESFPLEKNQVTVLINYDSKTGISYLLSN